MGNPRYQLDGADGPGGVDLTGARLTDAKVGRAHLRGAKLVSAVERLPSL